MQGVKQLIAPNKRAPQRPLAGTITSDQKPFGGNGEEGGYQSAAEIQKRKEQQRLAHAHVVVQQQQRREHQADEDNEAGRWRNDPHEFDERPLHSERQRRVIGRRFRESLAPLTLRQKNRRRPEPGGIFPQGVGRIVRRSRKTADQHVVAKDRARRQHGTVADKGAPSYVVAPQSNPTLAHS